MAALGILALGNAKLSRSATLTRRPDTPYDDLHRPSSANITFPPCGDMNLEVLDEAGEQDDRDGRSAARYRSPEPGQFASV